MNSEENDDYWDKSDIQNTSFTFDDEEDKTSRTNNTNDDDLSLMELVSGVTLSGRRNDKLPVIDLYALVTKKSVDYILNGSTTEEHVFIPFKDKLANQTSIDISNVVSNMSRGQDECLDPFKTLESKQQLLTCAIEKKNNNVILKVICFLARSLKPALINEILLKEPKAFDLYINFLIAKGNVSKAVELLDTLGFNKDAGILQFTNCVSSKSDPVMSLKSISNSYFLMDSDKVYIDNYIELLEWQKSVQHIRRDIYYSTAAHCIECIILSETNSLGSVMDVCRLLQIDDKLLYWVFLRGLCSRQLWSDISMLFLKKKWHGRIGLSTTVPVKEIVSEMATYMAPESELKKFLDTISDVSTKLHLAKKYKCFHLVVDILVDQKDRQALLNFRTQLPAQSESFFYAENYLRSHSVKWKN